jgi:hypothetical protein
MHLRKRMPLSNVVRTTSRQGSGSLLWEKFMTARLPKETLPYTVFASHYMVNMID